MPAASAVRSTSRTWPSYRASVDRRALPGVALSATTQADGAALKQSWIQVAKVGKFVSPVYGEFSITKADLASMVRNFIAVTPEPPTKLMVDYDHIGASPERPGDGIAAGWYQALELRANGKQLWALIEWTEAAAEKIAAKEYQFFSPMFAFNFTHSSGEAIGTTLLGGGITNRPFLEGMEPLSLSALKARGADAAIALATDEEPAASEAVEQLLSYDEQRNRLSRAVRESFGVTTVASDPYGPYPCCDVWLCDVFDGRVVYRHDGQQRYYEVAYRFEADGSVTFTSDPVEVVMTYAPLPAQNSEEIAMSQDPKQPTAPVAPVQGIEQHPAFLALKKAVEDQTVALQKHEETVLQLTAENKALKDAAKDQAAADAVDGLIRAGKVLPASRDHFIALHKTSGELFTNITASLKPVVSLNKEVGSAGDALEDSDVEARVDAQATAKMQELKCSRADALSAVFKADPALFEAYRKSTSVRV